MRRVDDLRGAGLAGHALGAVEGQPGVNGVEEGVAEGVVGVRVEAARQDAEGDVRRATGDVVQVKLDLVRCLRVQPPEGRKAGR